MRHVQRGTPHCHVKDKEHKQHCLDVQNGVVVLLNGAVRRAVISPKVRDLGSCGRRKGCKESS